MASQFFLEAFRFIVTENLSARLASVATAWTRTTLSRLRARSISSPQPRFARIKLFSGAQDCPMPSSRGTRRSEPPELRVLGSWSQCTRKNRKGAFHEPWELPPGFGVRQSSGALGSGRKDSLYYCPATAVSFRGV